MITIDGSIGEGGGQILRTSLALSMVTGKPFHITNIRAKREKPGLLRQHLTAVNAAVAVCSASVEGASIGSRELSFSPQSVKAGDYIFSVGSAGSTTLIFQTLMPALILANGSSTLTLEGGTHNPYAPPFDFLQKVFLPLVNRMGPTVHATMERAGFYPAGGGRWFVSITPAKELEPIHLCDRGEIRRKYATAFVAGLPGEIAKRELEKVGRMLNWNEEQLQIRQWPTEWGPGNVLTLEVESEHVTEMFTAFGMKGVTSEAVADAAVHQVRRYLAAKVPVGDCLADQLVLLLAVSGGGSFVTMAPTRHTRTNIEVISRFLPLQIKVSPTTEGYRIEIDRA